MAWATARRALVILVLATVAMATNPGVANAHHYPGWRPCDFHWWQGKWHMKQLVKCSAKRQGVSWATARRVIQCESRWEPGAYNPAGPYVGLGQHVLSSWPGRARRYGFAGWKWRNGRANGMVTIRYARDHGWGAWGCY